MDVNTAIKTRKSIRKFAKSRDIPEKMVLEILELGNHAPSAGNLQARDFIVVRDVKNKNLLAQVAYGQNFIATAPVVIVVCANQERSGGHYGPRGRTLYCIQDSDAAIENIMLIVHSYGLGACWIGAFDEALASEVLELPKHIRPLAIIPIGYPAEEPGPTSRIDLEKLIHYEKW
ncbi:MAG: nitroreductase family protein [Thermoplasmata archaeon]|nr:nitroreductase family protein [Thermoplasmata archaeon]